MHQFFHKIYEHVPVILTLICHHVFCLYAQIVYTYISGSNTNGVVAIDNVILQTQMDSCADCKKEFSFIQCLNSLYNSLSDYILN